MTTVAIPTHAVLDEWTSPLDLAAAGFLAGCKTSQTRAAYTYDLKVFFAWCAERDLPPLQARRPHIELYVRCLQAEPLAQATISRRVSVVCLFYRTAVIDEIIDKDPTVAVKRPSVDRSRQRRTWLTPLEMAKYIEAAKAESTNALALAMLLGECGLRISEACSLNVEDMIQVRGWDVIRFVGKGNKYAEVPIPVPVMRVLAEAIGDRTHGPVLTTKWGTRMTRTTAHRQIKQLAEKAGIRTDVSPHSFRRTMITTGLQLGVPLHHMQKAARHSDPKTTLIYDQSDALDNNAIHEVAGFYSQFA